MDEVIYSVFNKGEENKTLNTFNCIKKEFTILNGVFGRY